MGIFSWMFGSTGGSSRAAIRLDDRDPWEIGGTKDVESFLRALPLLCPSGGFVYFEGTGEPHVSEYLKSIAVDAPVRITLGTIWPRPDFYHVPIGATTMQSLAGFLETHPAGFFCAHCHVHDGSAVLLEWHDAFGADSMLVSSRVSDEKLIAFATALNRPYQRAYPQ
jgi:hypothetical protein